MTAPSACDFSCSNAQLKWIANQLTIAAASDPITAASIATDMATLLSALIDAYTAAIEELTLTYPEVTMVNQQGVFYLGITTQNQNPFPPARIYPTGSAPNTPGFIGREGVYNTELQALNSAIIYVFPGSNALAAAAAILQALPVRN